MNDTAVSIVVPVYNEVESLEPLCREIRRAMAETGLGYELLLVDDGSHDGSLEVMQQQAREDRRVRVFKHARNAGQSAAFVTGFQRARGEIVVTLDADLQNDPADIPRLIGELEHCDVACGVRVDRRDHFVRRASSRVANAVRRAVLGDGIRDVGCSLKAFRARFVRDLPVFNGLHRFLPAVVQWRGARVVEVPVHHRARRYGQAKYGVGNRLWRGIVDLVGVRWLRSRYIDPDNVIEVSAVRIRPARSGEPVQELPAFDSRSARKRS